MKGIYSVYNRILKEVVFKSDSIQECKEYINDNCLILTCYVCWTDEIKEFNF